MFNKTTAIIVATILYSIIFSALNSKSIQKAVGGEDSVFGFLFTSFGATWIVFMLIGGGFWFVVHILMSNLGPKKIEMETLQRFSDNSVNMLQKNDPDFDPTTFLNDCAKLASKLNHAWTLNKMENVRNLVSSGIYNRFRLQLELMKIEGVRNHMKNWFLDTIDLISVETDSIYQTAHVEINARAKDVTLPLNASSSEIENSIANAPQEMYFEVWSFVRKVSAITKKGKGLLSGNCPNCGANIEDLGESNQCKHCKTIINSGEYDWVLAEITQKEEWKPGQSSNSDMLEKIRSTNQSVNRQVIEDRASYLFWRWIESRVKGSKQPLKRYATSDFIDSFNAQKNYIVEAAVGAVDLKSCELENQEIIAKVVVLWSASFSEGSEPKNRKHVLTLKLPANSHPKNGLSENSCETCGAPLPESDSLKCDYCGQEIPATVDDWLLCGIDKG
jgi:hypothetical protein